MAKKIPTKKPQPVVEQPMTAEELVTAFSDEQLKDMQPYIAVRLRAFDTHNRDFLKRSLILRILQDLNNPDKCTPGLYQVVCRLLGEEELESDNIIAGSRVEELRKEMPEFDTED